MVGAGTAVRDDPLLLPTWPVPGPPGPRRPTGTAHPLDSLLLGSWTGARLDRPAPGPAPGPGLPGPGRGAEVRLPARDWIWKSWSRSLGEREITSLLVEGGPTLARVSWPRAWWTGCCCSSPRGSWGTPWRRAWEADLGPGTSGRRCPSKCAGPTDGPRRLHRTATPIGRTLTPAAPSPAGPCSLGPGGREPVSPASSRSSEPSGRSVPPGAGPAVLQGALPGSPWSWGRASPFPAPPDRPGSLPAASRSSLRETLRRTTLGSAGGVSR
jgi:hypothetical protein